MQIAARPLFLAPPSAYGSKPPEGSAPAPAPPPKDEEAGDDDFWENLSRKVGHVAHALTKVPEALLFIPEFLKFALFDAVLPLVGLAAQLGGVVGMVGVGVAGGMELADGVRRHDGAKVLAGGGEVARGLFLGSLAARSFGAEGLAQAGTPFAYLHGGLNLASGVMKMRQGEQMNRNDKKIVGMLEIGMGACTLAALHSTPARVPALALQGVLAAGKFGVTRQHQLKEWGHKVCERARETWEAFLGIFRDEEKPPPPEPPAPPEPDKTIHQSYWDMLVRKK
jgi:hypothetical protein